MPDHPVDAAATPVAPRTTGLGRLINRARRTDRSTIIATLVVTYLFGAALTWAMLTPMGAAPDEPGHVAYAAAVVRGDLGTPVPGGDEATRRIVMVTAPEWVNTFTSPPRTVENFNYPCFATVLFRTADCAPDLSGSTTLTEVPTTVGRYPPLFHAVVGLPTLVLSGSRAVYAMRIVAAALAAGSIGLGLALASPRRRTRLALAAVIAFTPTAAHLAGSVNPSGLEIAAALGLGIALMGTTASRPHRWWALPALGALSLALAWSRPLGYLTLTAVIAASLLINTNELRAWIRTAPRPRVLLATPLVAALTAIGYRIAWGLPVRAASAAGPATGSTLFSPTGLDVGIDTVERNLISWTLDLIGRFGWSDHAAPGLVLLVWTLAVLTLAFFVLLGTDRRHRLELLTIGLGALILAPLLAITRFVNASAYEARYHLPLASLIVVALAVVAIGMSSNDERRISLAILRWARVIAPAAMFASAAASLHRYAFGVEAQLVDIPDLARGGTQWLPPAEAVVAAALAIILVIGSAITLLVVARRDPTEQTAPTAIP